MKVPSLLALDHVHAPAAAPRQLAAIGLLALVMAVLGAMRLADLRDEEQALRSQAARELARPHAAQRPARDEPPTMAAAAPWDRLLDALETAAGPDVTLLSFDPAPERRQLRLEGEARNLLALLDYLRRVGAARPFVRAELQSHQASQDDPQHPVRFTLELSWREAA